MKTVKKILRYTKSQMFFYILAIICAAISVGFTLYIPVPVGEAIDFMIGKGAVDFDKILSAVIKIAVSIGLTVVFQWLMTYSTNVISARAVRDLRSDVFKKLNTMPLSYLDKNARGDLISRVTNDAEAVGDGLTQVITQLFSGIVTIVGTLIFMMSINIGLALVVVILTPLSMLVAGIIGRLCAKSFRDQQELQGEISSYVEEIVGNQKVVKAFAYEQRGEQSFEKLNSLRRHGYHRRAYGNLGVYGSPFHRRIVVLFDLREPVYKALQRSHGSSHPDPDRSRRGRKSFQGA